MFDHFLDITIIIFFGFATLYPILLTIVPMRSIDPGFYRFNLGLSIIIVHGGGPRIKRELEKSNIQSKFIRGLRVTDEKIINIVEDVLIDFNEDIVNSLIEKGSNAVSLNTKKK